MRIGAYPGTFDPPTVAHLAVAEAAHHQARLDRVELVVSEVGLGKEHARVRPATERAATLSEVATTRSWLSVRLTAGQLIADIAAGYDALIVGADKWAQVNDPAWYGSVEARDAALERLPEVFVAPRPPFPLPDNVTVLQLDDAYHQVSSTSVRAGRQEWRAPGT
jgi:hypothetical protein